MHSSEIPQPTALGPALCRLLPQVTAWLERENGASEQETTLQILKVGEELGEACAAWIGATGQNPRKGVTHSPGDVADELADVVIAALVAVRTLGFDPDTVLAERVDRVTARLDGREAGQILWPARRETAMSSVETAPAANLITEYTWRNNAYIAAGDATTDRAAAERAAATVRADNPGYDIALVSRVAGDWTEVADTDHVSRILGLVREYGQAHRMSQTRAEHRRPEWGDPDLTKARDIEAEITRLLTIDK